LTAEKGVTEEEASNRLFDTVDLAVACIAALTYLPLDVKNPATISGKSKVGVVKISLYNLHVYL